MEYLKLASLAKKIQMATDFTEPFLTVSFFRTQTRKIILNSLLEKLFEPELNNWWKMTDSTEKHENFIIAYAIFTKKLSVLRPNLQVVSRSHLNGIEFNTILAWKELAKLEVK